MGKVDVVGSPGVAYRWGFTVGETAYEVRALAARPKDDPPTTETRFALYECALLCTETAQLSGALGTTGVEVRVSVPLDTIGADAEDVLTGMRASTSLGEDVTGRTAVLDEVSLADAALPARSVGLGIAPAGTPESEVAFDTVAELADGRFSGSILASALLPQGYEAWARACLGDNCGAASVSVEREDTILELTVEGRGETLTLTARLAELDAPQIPLAGKTIDFYSDGQLIGSIETDDDGVASVPVPPPHRGNNRGYEAVFEGDAFYLGSSDDTSGGSNGGGSEAGGG